MSTIIITGSTTLRVLNVGGNKIGDDGYYIITGSTTLRVLNVGGNKIGDNGILMMSEGLQHNNSLTKLTVSSCGLSVKGEELKIFAYTSFSKFYY